MATTPILAHDDVARGIDPRVAAFEFSVEATLLVDPYGDQIIDANPAACALLGYDRALLRQTKASTLHAGELPALTVFTQAVLHKGAYWTTALDAAPCHRAKISGSNMPAASCPMTAACWCSSP